MREHVLEVSQELPGSLDEVFAFFADAMNLERLTPPWLAFEVLTPAPIAMHAGALIDYRLRLRGVPIRWRTEIEIWEPGVRFVDRQVRGPYQLWRHEHSFAACDGGTRVDDRVAFRSPGGRLLEPVVHRLFVREEVRRIFAYRTRVMAEVFGGGALPEVRIDGR